LITGTPVDRDELALGSEGDEITVVDVGCDRHRQLAAVLDVTRVLVGQVDGRKDADRFG
jgi:hypothetical protein